MIKIFDSGTDHILTKENILILLDEIEHDATKNEISGEPEEHPDLDGQLQMIEHFRYRINRLFVDKH